MKRYGVIIADPPWQYRRNERRGAAEKHYPTMTAEEVCSLPIRELAAEDSVLLLWTTWSQLREAFRVVEAWGFDYVTALPWIKTHGAPQLDLFGRTEFKVSYGIGFWARGVSELVMIAKRGKPKPPQLHFAGLLSPNYRHSRKPESLYQYAEAIEGPYLELFARETREGWDAWGNEAGEVPEWLADRLRESWQERARLREIVGEEASEPIPLHVIHEDWRRSLYQAESDQALHLFREGRSLCGTVKDEKTFSLLPGIGVETSILCKACLIVREAEGWTELWETAQ